MIQLSILLLFSSGLRHIHFGLVAALGCCSLAVAAASEDALIDVAFSRDAVIMTVHTSRPYSELRPEWSTDLQSWQKAERMEKISGEGLGGDLLRVHCVGPIEDRIYMRLLPGGDAFSHFFEDHITQDVIDDLVKETMESPQQPDRGHPRLYGSNEEWAAQLARWDELSQDFQMGGSYERGEVKNVHGLWFEATQGYNPYRGQSQSTFEGNKLTSSYYQGTSHKERLRTLHLIRRLDIWFAANADEHPMGSAAAFADFKRRFVTVEMEALRAEKRNEYGYIASWHKGYNNSFFDLGALPVFEFWCLFLDVFWDQGDALSESDKAYVASELGAEIDSYIESYHTQFWNLFNGNNWTPVLNAAAVYWAIVFYYEDDRAPEVLRIALETGWLHRGSYLSDGAYSEGPSYSATSFGPSHIINRLLLTSFGKPLQSFAWARFEDTAQWLVDNIMADGLSTDFSDSWASRGFASMMPLVMKLWRESAGMERYGATNIDPCFVKDYFAKSYFDHMFNADLWSLDPCMARDWRAIADQCEVGNTEGLSTTLYSGYQEGIMVTRLPGYNPHVPSGSDLYSLADTTSLAINATSSSFPHRELDSGGVIWSAFGDRLLWDFGYGIIGRHSRPYDYYEVATTKGRFAPRSSEDRLEFFLKPIEGSPNWNALEVSIKVRYATYSLIVGNYLSAAGEDGWMKVSIPLADFEVPENRWQEGAGDEAWEGAGVVLFGLKALSSFGGNSVFGLDEIRFVSVDNEASSLLWFGDGHTDAALPGAQSSNKPGTFYQESLALSGGAVDGGNWIRLKQTSLGTTLSFEYNDNPEERSVINRLDNVPLGTNTLIVPKQFYVDPKLGEQRFTNTTQLTGVDATSSVRTVSDVEVIEVDQSATYGADSEIGPMRYYKRWTYGLGEGSYLIIDAYRLKEGIEEKAQEFWYFKLSDDRAGCNRSSFSDTIDVALQGPHAIAIEPQCWQIAWQGESQTSARMLGAALRSGRFHDSIPSFLADDVYFRRFLRGNAIVLKNALQNLETRQLLRWEPDAIEAEDVRVFLLVAAPDAVLLPNPLALEKSAETSDSVSFSYQVGSLSGTVVLRRNEAKHFDLSAIALREP